MREAPQRPYKNLEDYRRCFYSFRHGKDTSKWPCLHCRGAGSIYDPNDPPDCYEGNKLRRILTCQVCSGTGCGPREACWRAYKASISRWREQLGVYKHLLAIWKEVQSKLTEEEKRALAEFGVRP